MHRILFLVFLAFLYFTANAQTDLPTDYLTREFHRTRRDSLRNRMPENSVMAIFSYPSRTFSNDVEYLYHPNPDLFYFTGYKEPDALLLIFKDSQQLAGESNCKELFFVQERNAAAEQWTGRRLGKEGVKTQLGISGVYDGSAFNDFNLDLSTFGKIIFQSFPEDIADDKFNKADLADLIKLFKKKAGINGDYATEKKFSNGLYMQLTSALREIKTAEEMDLLRKAIEISCIGQLEVMKAARADMSEAEIQGLHEFVHKKYGAENIGYPSIVGAGNNGCILHYIDNNKTKAGNQLLLMDVGAEYHGYTADVTRTIPANGKFSAAQKIIYDLVYQAQEEAFNLCREGASWQELSAKAREVIATGLLKLGIIKDKKEVSKYFPHGLGHHIGLDVHDKGFSPRLKKGMVITIEPGIYIPDNSPCDKKWWGIAVRIEDDILIREKDYELLSNAAPRKAADIEKAMAEKSALDDFILPKLKSAKKSF